MFGITEINKDTIVKIGNPILTIKSSEETFPLSDFKRQTIERMRTYLIESNNEQIAKEKNLEPAVGIAAPQIGINSRFCCIYVLDEDDEVVCDLQLINPIITRSSENLVYLGGGEGCLSIPNKIEGYVHRSDEIEVEYYDLGGNFHKITATDFLAVVIQHEIDHLNGILYPDHINTDNPFEIKKNSVEL